MGTRIPARPTEFKGTVYRSKSEAMFAASLDYIGVNWVYEPYFFDFDNWVVDFAIPVHEGNYFEWVLIEYKPSRVTQTCLRELAARFANCRARSSFSLTTRVVSFNWFDPAACDIVYNCAADETVSVAGRCEDAGYITKSSYGHAKATRFDLEQSASQECADLMGIINRIRASQGIRHVTN